MGQEAWCNCHFEGATSYGRANLEHDALYFRGTFRIAAKLEDIVGVEAEQGRMFVRVKNGDEFALDLGRKAEPWRNKIANPPSLMERLGVRAGCAVGIVGSLDGGLIDQIAAVADVHVAPLPPQLEVILFAVEQRADLRRLAELAGHLRPNGGLWVIRPKGRNSPVPERDVYAAAAAAQLVDVKVSRFSATHSAQKLMIPTRYR